MVAHQVQREAEAVGEPLDADEGVEGAVRRGKADAVQPGQPVRHQAPALGAMGAEGIDEAPVGDSGERRLLTKGAVPEWVASATSAMASRVPSGTPASRFASRSSPRSC